MHDSANVTLLFNLFADQLAELENAVAELGIEIPDSLIARPLNDAIKLVEHAAVLMHEQYGSWNAELFAREEPLRPTNAERNAARELGRRSHAWYAASKVLYA